MNLWYGIKGDQSWVRIYPRSCVATVWCPCTLWSKGNGPWASCLFGSESWCLTLYTSHEEGFFWLAGACEYDFVFSVSNISLCFNRSIFPWPSAAYRKEVPAFKWVLEELGLELLIRLKTLIPQYSLNVGAVNYRTSQNRTLLPTAHCPLVVVIDSISGQLFSLWREEPESSEHLSMFVSYWCLISVQTAESWEQQKPPLYPTPNGHEQLAREFLAFSIIHIQVQHHPYFMSLVDLLKARKGRRLITSCHTRPPEHTPGRELKSVYPHVLTQISKTNLEDQDFPPWF